MGGYVLGEKPAISSFPWLTQNEITQRYGEHGETGIDLGMVVGTPITSLTPGVIGPGSGYDSTGGFVGVLSQINGEKVAVYYQHLDLLAVSDGQHVSAGTLLGYSGGQTSGGHHPAWQGSSGPHVEVGVNFPWGGGRNPEHWGPNYDPLPLLQALALNRDPVAAITGQATALVVKATTAPGFGAIAQAIDDAMTFDSFDIRNPVGSVAHNTGAFTARAVPVIIGLLILTAVIFWLLRPAVEQGTAVAAELAPLAA